MNSDTLRVKTTNTGREFSGGLWGLELRHARWVALAMAVGLGVFLLARRDGGDDLGWFSWLVILPALLLGLGLIFLGQGRYRGFSRDLAETAVSRGDAAPGGMPTILDRLFGSAYPEAFLAGGILVIDGLGPGGWVAKGFLVEVPELLHASERDLNAFDERLRSVLKLLPEGYRLQVCWGTDSNCEQTLSDYNVDTVKIADSACRKAREQTFLFLHGLWRRGALRRDWVQLFVAKPIAARPAPWKARSAEKHYEEVLKQCGSDLDEFGRRLHELVASQGGSATPLSDEAVYRAVLGTLNPTLRPRLRSDATVTLDHARSLQEQCWRSAIRCRGVRGIWLDEHYATVLAISAWPTQTHPGILNRLCILPFGNYRLTLQAERLPVEPLLAKEQRDLDRLENQLAAKPNQRLEVTRDRAQERIRRLTEHETIPMVASLSISLTAPSPEVLSERVSAVKHALHGMNGTRYAEGLPAFTKNAFLRTVPGNVCGHPGYQLPAEASYLTPLMPLRSSFVGQLEKPDALFLGAYGTLVGMKLFVGDAQHVLPINYLIVGAPGTGKSVVAGHLLMQAAAQFGLIVIIEEGFSHVGLVRALAGNTLVFSLTGQHRINLFDTHGLPLDESHRSLMVALIARMVGGPADSASNPDTSAIIAKHLSILCHDFAHDRLRRMGARDRRRFVREALAVFNHAQAHQLPLGEAYLAVRTNGTGAVPESDAPPTAAEFEFEATHPEVLEPLVFATLAPAEHLTLSAFKEHLELVDEAAEREACTRLAARLAPYTGDGIYARLVDGPSNVALTNRIAHFELGQIPESARELKAVLGTLVTHYVRQHVLGLPRTVKKLLVLEELARFLDLPDTDAFVRELYSQMRKANVVVVSILQLIQQLADPKLRAAVLGNTSSYLIFNPGDRGDLALLAQEIGLSNAAQEAILKYRKPAMIPGQKFSEFMFFHNDPARPLCGTVRHFLPEAGEKSSASSPQPSNHPHIA